MQLNLPDRTINVFSVIYRDEAIQEYDAGFVFDFISNARKYGYTGLLLFEANRSNLDPWVIGQHAMAEGLTPFIAINPVYMHPFAAARKISALSKLYQRKVFINFITGTSDSDLLNLNDKLTHDERYERLSEYIYIFDRLLKSHSPLTFNGNHYQVSNLLVSARMEPEHFPFYFVAGASSKAKEVRERFGASSASMGKDVSGFQKHRMMPDSGSAMHFGILADSTDEAAHHQLHRWIGEDNQGASDIFLRSMDNTQSKWKQELISQQNADDPIFSLDPLRHFRADCPYYIGGYDEVAERIMTIVMNGYSTLMVETPDFPSGFAVLEQCFAIAKTRLLEVCYGNIHPQFEFNF